MGTRALAIHSAWAIAVALAFFLGRAVEPETRSEVARPVEPPGDSGAQPIPTSTRGDPGDLTALGHQRRVRHPVPDPEEVLLAAEGFVDRLTDADNPLAFLESMPAEERDMAMREVVIAELAGWDEAGTRTLLDNDLFGLDREGVRQFFYWAALEGDLSGASEEEMLRRIGASEETIKFTLTEAKRSRSRRDAQNMASVYSSALAAGADFDGVRDVRGMIDKLSEGVYGGEGFESTMFRVPHLSEEEIAGAMRYLVVDDSGSMLLYQSDVD